MGRCEQMIDHLRDILNKRGNRGICALGKWFKIADTDHSQSLDRDEFTVRAGKSSRNALK